MAVRLFVTLGAIFSFHGILSGYPFHAECELTWSWIDTDCSDVKKALINIAEKWRGPEGCSQGGEKCLYTIVTNTSNVLGLTHKTPQKMYVDDISFQFCDGASKCGGNAANLALTKKFVPLIETLKMNKNDLGGCRVIGHSKSEVWYAILDYGTNYCNMRNLADGAGLTKLGGFREDTDDTICTQYSSSDCNVY